VLAGARGQDAFSARSGWLFKAQVQVEHGSPTSAPPAPAPPTQAATGGRLPLFESRGIPVQVRSAPPSRGAVAPATALQETVPEMARRTAASIEVASRALGGGDAVLAPGAAPEFAEACKEVEGVRIEIMERARGRGVDRDVAVLLWPGQFRAVPTLLGREDADIDTDVADTSSRKRKRGFDSDDVQVQDVLSFMDVTGADFPAVTRMRLRDAVADNRRLRTHLSDAVQAQATFPTTFAGTVSELHAAIALIKRTHLSEADEESPRHVRLLADLRRALRDVSQFRPVARDLENASLRCRSSPSASAALASIKTAAAEGAALSTIWHATVLDQLHDTHAYLEATSKLTAREHSLSIQTVTVKADKAMNQELLRESLLVLKLVKGLLQLADGQAAVVASERAASKLEVATLLASLGRLSAALSHCEEVCEPLLTRTGATFERATSTSARTTSTAGYTSQYDRASRAVRLLSDNFSVLFGEVTALRADATKFIRRERAHSARIGALLDPQEAWYRKFADQLAGLLKRTRTKKRSQGPPHPVFVSPPSQPSALAPHNEPRDLPFLAPEHPLSPRARARTPRLYTRPRAHLL